MTDFETELDNLAAAIAKEAAGTGDDAPAFADRVDALKVLTAFYVAKKKNPHSEDDDLEGFNFQKALNGAKEPVNEQSPAPPVRSRRRHTGPEH